MQGEHEFTVVLERDEDGMVIATVPALPGCHSVGESEEEAREMVRDAIRLHVEDRIAIRQATVTP
jgi:predicted RNase H-like HicB family nuclease